MALEFMDGFDYYTANADLLAKWDAGSNASGGAVQGGGRFGGNGFLLGRSFTFLQKTLTNQKTRIAGAAIYLSAYPYAPGRILAFQDGGTTQLDLRISNGQLIVTRNGTQIGASTATVGLNGWFYIEMRATVDAAAGSFDVHLNGISVLSATNINTQASSNAYSNAVVFFGSDGGGVLIDDVFILNTASPGLNGFLGECKIATVVPSADGTNKTWTPLSGTTNFSQVVTSDGDSSYVSTGTAGAIDTYKFPAQTLPGAILGVQASVSQRKSDTGVRVTCVEYRSAAGTNYDGANQFALSSSYTTGFQLYETDPATGAPWTNAGLNGAEFGVKCVS